VGEPKVVSLLGHAISAPYEPVESVVAACERAAEAARSGEVCGVTIVFNHADDTTSRVSVGSRGRATIGALEMVKADLIEWLRSQ
jgi:hypothetical protein